MRVPVPLSAVLIQHDFSLGEETATLVQSQDLAPREHEEALVRVDFVGNERQTGDAARCERDLHGQLDQVPAQSRRCGGGGGGGGDSSAVSGNSCRCRTVAVGAVQVLET